MAHRAGTMWVCGHGSCQTVVPMEYEMRLEVLQERECGGCTECCHSLGVPEFGKTSHETCRFAVCGQGCRVYRVRPRSCRAFECLWKQGWFSEAERPDRSGVIFALQYQHATRRPTLTLYMRDADWEQSPRFKRLVDQLSASDTIVVISPAGHSILATESEAAIVLANVNAFLESRGHEPMADGAMHQPETGDRPGPVLHIRENVEAILFNSEADRTGQAVASP